MTPHGPPARPGRDPDAFGRDPDAFEAFYRAHLETVRRFVVRRVDDVHVAADLTADVFVAAIESADRYDPRRGTPGAWLTGIARHVVSAYVRTSAREAAAGRRIDARELLDEDSAARIAARIDAERPARVLFRALQDLPEGQRAVVELVAVDGLALTEAARVLGITATAARVRYHRARTVLRGALDRQTAGGTSALGTTPSEVTP